MREAWRKNSCKGLHPSNTLLILLCDSMGHHGNSQKHQTVWKLPFLEQCKTPKTTTILKFCVTPLGLYLTFTNCFQIIWWRHFTPTRVKRTKQNVCRGRVGTCLILVQNASCSSQKSSPFHCRCGQSLRHMAPLYWLCCRAHVLRAHCRIYLCTDFTIISEMPFHLSSLLWAQIGLSLFL